MGTTKWRIRLKYLPGQLLMMAGVVLSITGLYIGIVGMRNKKSRSVDLHGIVVNEVDLGSFLLFGNEVLAVVGGVTFMLGFSLVYRLTAGGNSSWVEM